MDLKNWLQVNFIAHEFLSDSIVVIDSRIFYVLTHKKQTFEIGTSGKTEERNVIFDKNFELIISEEEGVEIVEHDIDTVIFNFGQKWYYSSINKVQLIPLKYLGESESQGNLPHLGVHGSYEICNGSRDYEAWCQKAKFLRINTLGICEHNTLAGTLAFQLACKKFKIKSILGETIVVRSTDPAFSELDYKVKLYVHDEIGWNNLLLIHSQIKVFNDNFVFDNYLWEHSQGLSCVIESNIVLNPALVKKYLKVFNENLYYQLNFTEWASADYDKQYLNNIQHYFKHFHKLVKPILIQDSYYLDKEDHYIKKIINQIGKVGFQYQAKEQHFKCIEETVFQTEELFKTTEKCDEILNEAIANVEDLCAKSDFSISVNELHLPQYVMKEDEAKKFATNVDLFWFLIDKGLEEKIIGQVEDEDIYIKRIDRESKLIIEGNLVDYFLITWDILNWCQQNKILTGIGRGSSAGSLICYLLNIVKIDPLKYDLLFERFINESRIVSGLPDIDNDLQSDRRDDVKRYIESRYGEENVVSIGTYGNFKMRAAIKDLSRFYGIDPGTANYISAMIHPECSIEELFMSATAISPLKQHIQSYPHIFNAVPLIYDQPKTESMHAAGIVISPRIYKGVKKTIFDWMPVKKVDGVLVSEWEGPQLEKAGFLKEDILGIKQLEKFARIFELIKQNHGIDIDFNHFDVEVPGVYELFQQGFNEDVFQFGAQGLKNYCSELQPESIHDLIATVALYRPGPIGSGSHKDYIKIKNGLKSPEYDYMLQEVTKETHSMYIYQEQVMQAMTILGGFSLTEADEIRSAMGKKKMDKMESYKEQFIERAIDKGCDKFEALKIWNKLVTFAEYGFNKSHATVYAYTGYFCQWLKYMYPIEFWTVSLHYSNDEEVGQRISEMTRTSEVKVIAPDINQSVLTFQSDFKTNKIYWSLASIKFAGEGAVNAIIGERTANGPFFSLSEFLTRVPKRTVNKRVITNLILSGCFDQIEKINAPKDRFKLIELYYKKHLLEPLPEEFLDSSLNWKDYFWTLKQKELTGFGYIDFQMIFKSLDFPNKVSYISELHFELDSCKGDNKCVGGIVHEVIERNSKKGNFAQIILNCNDRMIVVLMWAEIWQDFRAELTPTKGKIVFVTGELKFDDFRKQNILQTNLKTEARIL